MFCENCGKDIQDSNFCPYCGTKQSDEQPAPVSNEAPAQPAPVSNEAPAQPAPVSNEAPAQPNPQPQQVGNQIPTMSQNGPVIVNNQQATNTGSTYNKSAAATVATTGLSSANNFLQQAWNVFVCNPRLVGRSFLFGLLLLIPVVNFFAIGYIANEGMKHTNRQDNDTLPSVFNLDNFVKGFFIFVVFVIAALIIYLFFLPWNSLITNYSIINKIFGWLLFIIALAASACLFTILGLMASRMSLMGFAPGFNFVKIFSAIKKRPVATLIYVGITILCSFIVFELVSMLLQTGSYFLVKGAYPSYYFYEATLPPFSLTSWVGIYAVAQNNFSAATALIPYSDFFGLVFILYAIVLYLSTVALSITLIVSFICIGRYVGDFCSDWLPESDSYNERVAKMREQRRIEAEAQAAKAAAEAAAQQVATTKITLTTQDKQSADLESYPATIGNDPKATLAINDNNMAPFHATIFIENNTLWLANTSSDKTIEYNGITVQPNMKMSINNGDTFTVGQVIFNITVS